MSVDNSLPTKQLTALEQLKFTTDSDGNVIVRTSAKGTFQTTGLNVGQEFSKTLVSDTATQIPPTALLNRNHISIHNTSDTITVFIGNSDVDTDDWELSPGEKVDVDVTDGIPFYAICATGESAYIKTWEIA